MKGTTMTHLTLWDSDPLLDKHQVAERLIAEKRIAYIKVGRHARMRASAIDAFVAANTLSSALRVEILESSVEVPLTQLRLAKHPNGIPEVEATGVTQERCGQSTALVMNGCTLSEIANVSQRQISREGGTGR
jgi:hypothetical protein